MQATDLVINLVLLITFVTFYWTIAWGLIRYSKRQGFRLWAIGWLIYTIGALQGGFASSESGLSPFDVIAINAMFLGATLILDGTRNSELTRRRLQLYVVGMAFFTCLLVVGLLTQLGFQYVFIPLGFYVLYVSVLASRTIYGFENIADISKWWLVLGLLTVAASWLIFPFTLVVFDFFQFFIIIQAIGVAVTGSSMLTLFTGTVTSDLETQYQISEIISGLVQHDIRNYIQTAHHALELTEGEDVVENHWIQIATEVLDDAGHFVDEIRDISVSLSQAQTPSERIRLDTVVNRVKERVVKEYKLSPEQIQIQIRSDMMVENTRLIDEMLWNIFDNAFKHGSPSLTIQSTNSDAHGVELAISDRGAGLSENIMAFLNSPDAISKQDRPVIGLGVLLIRGIASLCSIHLHVSDNVEDNSVIGTTYYLRFNGTI